MGDSVSTMARTGVLDKKEYLTRSKGIKPPDERARIVRCYAAVV